MLTGVILAGGHSRRMGQNKALLPVGGRALVEVVAARLREAGLGPLVLVANDPEPYARTGLPVVPDALPPGHPLVGVYSGVLHAGGPAFVCACDMPFLSPALVAHMAALSDGVDAVVPRHGRKYEPLHAVYTPACLDAIRRCVAEGRRSAGFLADVRVRFVDRDEVRRFDPALLSFFNVNTPDEYADALARFPR